VDHRGSWQSRCVKTCPVCRASYPGKPPRCPLDGATLEDSGPDLLGGRVVAGRYRLVERVGVGTTAEVYRTHDLRSGAVVAARVPVQHGHEASRVRIHDQVKAFRMAAPHEALVPVLDLLDRAVAGRVVAITEYVSAPPLPHLLAAGPLALPVALEAGARLAALLEHLHTRDVLARDLRASAVFVAATPGSVGVKLSIDALAPGPVCPPETLPSATGERAHMAIGYVAPERIRAEPVSPAADIYALGALLFEMAAGRPAFQGDAAEIVRAHLESPAPVLRQVDPAAPRALEALLARMLAKRAQFRPSAADVRRELESLRGTL
jgi:serine/threonine protein kinase